jgi:hypothetical protein
MKPRIPNFETTPMGAADGSSSTRESASVTMSGFHSVAVRYQFQAGFASDVPVAGRVGALGALAAKRE